MRSETLGLTPCLKHTFVPHPSRTGVRSETLGLTPCLKRNWHSCPSADASVRNTGAHALFETSSTVSSRTRTSRSETLGLTPCLKLLPVSHPVSDDARSETLGLTPCLKLVTAGWFLTIAVFAVRNTGAHALFETRHSEQLA